MGRKSRSKFNRMLRAGPATEADSRRLSDRERMKRVLWKMVERYEQDLTSNEAKPKVTGSQAIAAMRMLRDIDDEEDREAEAREAAEEFKRAYGNGSIFMPAAQPTPAGKEQADAAPRAIARESLAVGV